MKWVSIDGFSKYEVSEDGQIRSVDRVIPAYVDSLGRNMPERKLSGVLRKPRRHEFGYLMVDLMSDEGKICGMTVHRALAIGFKGPAPFEGAVARHMDGNCENNVPSNIEWGSQKDNIHDAMKHGTVQKGEARYNAKLTEADVIAIRERILSGDKFAIVAVDFDISESICYRIATGEKWASVGGPLYRPARQKRLSPEDIEVVRSRLLAGEKVKPLSREFKVSNTQIKAIRDGRK